MKNRTIILTIIIIILLNYIYTIVYIKYRKLTTKRPVYINSRKKRGLIMNSHDLNDYELPNNCTKKIFTKQELHILIDFINTHFEGEESKITESYIKWHLDNMLENKLMFGLEYNNKLCGVITGNVIDINIDNQIYKSIYVDFLCVVKIHRSKKYASILLSFILNTCKQNNCKVFLFKKDITQYYFDHMYSNNYYLLNTSKHYIKSNNIINYSTIEIKELKNNKQLIQELYTLYKTYSSKYRIHEYFDIKRFASKLLDETVITLVLFINKKICGYIVLSKRYYVYFKNDVHDIYQFIISTDDSNNQKRLELINNILLNYMKSNNIKYVISSLNPSTDHIIKYFKMNKCSRSYYYLYNYNIPGIKAKDVLVSY